MIANVYHQASPIPLCVIVPLWTILPRTPVKSDCTSCVSGSLGNGGRGVRSVFGLKREDKREVKRPRRQDRRRRLRAGSRAGAEWQ